MPITKEPEKNILEYEDLSPKIEGQQRRIRNRGGTIIVVWTSCSICHKPRWVRRKGRFRDYLGDNICKRCTVEQQRQSGKARFEQRVRENRWTLKGQYVLSSTPVSLVCDFGHEFEQVPDHTVQGERCKFCSGHAVHADKINEICSDTQCTLKIWNSGVTKSLWQCNVCSTEFEQYWSVLCRPHATGCQRCFGKNVGEEMVRSWIEATTNQKCPPWTIPGTRYRIDILVNGRLPIEVDGPHHRGDVPYNKEGFESVARRDAIKDELCRQHLGTAPRRIVWDGDWNLLEIQVLKFLREVGYDIESLPSLRPTSKLIREREYLAEFGYKLNASVYRGQSILESVTCPNNHEYRVTFNNFKRGKRCKRCYYIRLSRD